MTSRTRAAQLVPWLVRGLWATLPFTAGPVFARALDGASTPVRTLCSLGLWGGWATGVLASLVPHPATLTALRVLAPAGLAGALAAAAGGEASPVAVAWTAVTAGWAFSPTVGFRWVNGPAYGNERRFPLRAPAPLLFGPLALVWAIAICALATGPLLLAAERWVAGTVAVVIGAPVSILLLRSMHNLARRWLVFVPAGVVLHDPIALVDPVLFPRRSIRSLRPAPAPGGEVLDLRQRAPGLAIELTVTEPAAVMLVRPGRREGEMVKASTFLFTPTRPGAVVEEARSRRFPVR